MLVFKFLPKVVFMSEACHLPQMKFPDIVTNALRHNGINWIVAVPASGVDAIYKAYEGQKRRIFATREEEAVAIAAGLRMGGASPAVLMQQSGVGNCLNAVFTLADAYKIYFPILVFDRSENDPNLVQQVSSRKTSLALGNLEYSAFDWNSNDADGKFAMLLRKEIRWINCVMTGGEK